MVLDLMAKVGRRTRGNCRFTLNKTGTEAVFDKVRVCSIHPGMAFRSFRHVFVVSQKFLKNWHVT